ncbi:RHS repeat protein [Methylobacter sp. G7]|uniref:RHS repeat protein n=1 Tax=Methylobacter sp. G7 TaxID=3230117 RepID=UPI003D802D9E
MKFVISYPQTNWDYAKFRLERIIKGKDRSNEVFKGEPGGKIQLLDHQGQLGKIQLLDEIYPTKPFGMEFVEGEGLYYICGLPCAEDGVAGDEHIERLNDKGEVDLKIRSPLFSQLRSLRRTKDGFLVTASGIDAILEVDFEGNVIWSWWATECGYPNAYGGGVRQIDKTMDHRLKCYSGKLQSTHLNSAIIDPYDNNKILTILFYQGAVVRIDRKTLALDVVITGLNGAHHIRPHSKGYMLSNSRKGEVLIYDHDFKLTDRIKGTNALFPVKWVQDAFEMPGGLSHLIADCNTFNLRERDSEGNEKTFNTRMPNRIFQIEPVSDAFSFKGY